MNNVYEIPRVEKETYSGSTQVSLLTEAFSDRRIFLFGEINEGQVYSFTMQMLHMLKDETSEISIIINSLGGEEIYTSPQLCHAP